MYLKTKNFISSSKVFYLRVTDDEDRRITSRTIIVWLFHVNNVVMYSDGKESSISYTKKKHTMIYHCEYLTNVNLGTPYLPDGQDFYILI
jgi:hypothetical protein